LPSFIGKKFSVYNANTFAHSFARDPIYLYVGKVAAWADEDNPPSANDVPADHNNIWNKMAGLVRVNRNQVSLGIKRNDWLTGTKYEMYHSANTKLGTNYHVLAGVMDRDVYKCIDNNGYSPSSSKPTHKNLGATKEIDGYVWKYMYTIPETTFKKFATSTVIPAFRDGDVSSFSKLGRILHLPISANSSTGIGAYYRGHGFVNGSYSALASNATIYTTVHANSATNQLKIIADSGLAIQQDYYNNCAFMITSGKAKGTYRRISDSWPDGVERDVGYSQDKATNLFFNTSVSNIANGDMFKIGPIVTVSGDINGRGFLGIGNVNRYGNVTSIDVALTGTNYANSDATVSVLGHYHATTNSLYDGTGALVDLAIPPSGGGHGYNPLMELNAKYVIVSPETPLPKDHQTGIFAGYNNEIRQVGLIKNPINSVTGLPAYGASYDARTTLYFASPTSIKFEKDQRVYNTSDPVGSESASGLVHSICGDSQNQYLALSDVQGQFANGDVVYNRLGDTATIASANLAFHKYPINSEIKPVNSVINPQLAKYTGEILYHENISPITRRIDQKENFKFVFEF